MTNIKARLNHGRWIADCPKCGGAELVVPGQAFVCFSCYPYLRAAFFPKITGQVVALPAHDEYNVVFPKDKSAIDAAVLKRPVVNQNWETKETINILLAENVAHGIKE